MIGYVIEYHPRVEDPVIIARFSTLKGAETCLEEIKNKKPRVSKYHKIVEVKDGIRME
jgi:hypothetical protein